MSFGSKCMGVAYQDTDRRLLDFRIDGITEKQLQSAECNKNASAATAAPLSLDADVGVAAKIAATNFALVLMRVPALVEGYETFHTPHQPTGRRLRKILERENALYYSAHTCYESDLVGVRSEELEAYGMARKFHTRLLSGKF